MSYVISYFMMGIYAVNSKYILATINKNVTHIML